AREHGSTDKAAGLVTARRANEICVSRIGAPIGPLMALGSICFVLALSELPVGTATAISTSYVLLVLFLSWLFLSESMSWMKIAGTLLTITGVALLSWQKK